MTGALCFQTEDGSKQLLKLLSFSLGLVELTKSLKLIIFSAHRNTKLFITHNGYLSTIETAYCNVPTVSIPFFGDQFGNAQYANETGSAFVIPLNNFGSETLGNAIEEVISNPK